MKEDINTVRLDRWLNAARFYKTRTQAAKACEGGKIKVNGQTAKPHKFLHIGDKLTIHVHSRYRDLEVLGLAQRGLPASEAQKLYLEDEKRKLTKEGEELVELFRETQKKYRRKFKGRPTKRERRKMDQMKWNSK
jgi:ribosome-associated heat shock protein Hsp15